MQHNSKFQWQLNIKILIFVLVFTPVTLGLGFWQLDRADEKTRILAEQQARTQMPPLNNDTLLDTENAHLRRFSLMVEYDPQRWFLLDNRVRQGRPGYEVLNLANLAGTDKLILLNRGWVPAELDRNQLPELEIPTGQIEIRGYIYMPTENYFMLGEQSWRGSWPERIQHADPEVIGEFLADGDFLLPMRLRLASDDPQAFVADWQIVNQQPQKHFGYAVQWFAMMLALLILGVFANSNLGQILTNKRE